MTETPPKIRIGDLSTEIQVLVEYGDYDDSIHVVDLSTATAQKITIKDPDGKTVIDKADTSNVNTGTDGLAKYITDGTTSIWNKPGMWTWFITYTVPSGKFSTEDAIREILE